ncbi:MAG: L-threonylcarbamoyladenylate synthase, partial [Desulfovibrionales bacterium]
VDMVVEKTVPGMEKLIETFWPGPLSLVVPGRGSLPDQVVDSQGQVCVRWSPHPLASFLSRRSRRPLVATSANRNGEEPAKDILQIHHALRKNVDAIVEEPPYPEGGLPSTIIRPVSEKEVLILRQGVVSPDALKIAGFRTRS